MYKGGQQCPFTTVEINGWFTADYLLGDRMIQQNGSATFAFARLEIPGLEVSSSEIRRRLREGRSVRYLLPESVLAPVLESGIYQQSEPGESA